MHKNIRTKTYQDLLDKLNEYGRCAIIRPTGFGKTWMLTTLIQSGFYNKILYLYPADVVRNTVVNKYFNDMRDKKQLEFEEMKKDANSSEYDEETAQLFLNIERMREEALIDGVDLMTYSKLVRLNSSDFKEMDYDLIILDECHRLGAKNTKISLSKLLAYNTNTHIVGATATPNRTDAFDVIHTFFNDVCTFEYNLHDAFTDGLIQKPYYCYCTYDTETDLKDEALLLGEDLNDNTVLEVLKKKLIEISNIYNIETVIKDTCDKFAYNTDYMKFIVFFGNMKHMQIKSKDVKQWFENAYPSHTITELVISSKNQDTRLNVDKLDSLKYKPKTIDLVYCIDMLNMGYHVDDLTGILMYRGTSSDIIFLQQLGRAFSSGATHPSIVFDIVDNLHRKAICENIDHKKISKSKLKHNTTLSMNWHLNEQNELVDLDGDPAPLKYENGVIIDMLGNPTSFIIDENGYVIDGYISKDMLELKRNCNRITAEDLIATGHEATYRELIAKAVAEPMSQRCKQVVELHFKKWCKINRLPYPITDDEIRKLSDLSREDFRTEFRQIVMDNKLDYPLHDASKLLALGDKDGMVPLRLFAKMKNVQISQILELLGLTND